MHLSLPSLSISSAKLGSENKIATRASKNSLVNKPLPNFTLSDTNGSLLHTADLLGKPTLISVGATWSPTMSEQLEALNNLQSNPNINIVPIALQQNLGQVQAYTSIAGLNLNWLVDPNSTLSSSFGAPYLPTQYFVDRNGIVRQVYVGVLSQEQIENMLGAL